MNTQECEIDPAVKTAIQSFFRDNSFTPAIGYKVKREPGICEKADFINTFHLKSGKGTLKVKISDIPDEQKSQTQVISYLQRKNKTYATIPVDKVCSKHSNRTEQNKQGHVLQSTNASARYMEPDQDQIYPAVCQDYAKNLTFKIICNDSCQTSSSSTINEAARDMQLVMLFVTNISSEPKVAYISKINIWPKATVNPRDLQKSVRREAPVPRTYICSL